MVIFLGRELKQQNRCVAAKTSPRPWNLKREQRHHHAPPARPRKANVNHDKNVPAARLEIAQTLKANPSRPIALTGAARPPRGRRG